MKIDHKNNVVEGRYNNRLFEQDNGIDRILEDLKVTNHHKHIIYTDSERNPVEEVKEEYEAKIQGYEQRIAELEELATVDGLTGLLNKREFEMRLESTLKKTERDNEYLSLIIMDIDNFKHYNDTNGHVEGDKMLRQVADVVKDVSRAGSICCRYGGEENVVILPGACAGEAAVVAERYRNEVSKRTGVTISVGVAEYSAGDTAEDLVRRSDQALYKAKDLGKDRVNVYQEAV